MVEKWPPLVQTSSNFILIAAGFYLQFVEATTCYFPLETSTYSAIFFNSRSVVMTNVNGYLQAKGGKNLAKLSWF